MTAVQLGPSPTPRQALAGLPVRLPLSTAGLELLAAGAGVRLPWQRPPAASTALAQRLGGRDPSPRQSDATEPSSEDDPVAEVAALGAVDDDGRLRPALLAALAGFARAEVAVDVEVGRRVGGGFAALRSWQRRWGDRVTWLTLTGDRVELGWCGVSGWSAQLTALAGGGTDAAGAPGDPADVVPPPGLTLPLPLLLASGEAVTSGRDDLLAELLRQHPVAGDHEQVRRVHQGVRARLQATVAGHGPSGDRRLGLVSWLRYGDGWRALVPETRDGVPWVRLDPVPPSRLAADVARLEQGVRG